MLQDNTVTNTNTIVLTGTGILPVPTFAITSPPASTSVKAGTAITFAASVTSTTSPGADRQSDDAAGRSGHQRQHGHAEFLRVASLSVVTSVTGPHTLSATYSGDPNYAAAGPITRTYTVTAAASKTALTSSANPAKYCTPVDFSVSVTGTSGVKPTGKVELKKGTMVLATATLNNAAAKLSTSALPVETNMLTASYSGDARNEASTSPAIKQIVLSGSGSCSAFVP